MPSLKIEARQVTDAILKDNSFMIAFLDLCQYFSHAPLARMNFLNHVTTQIAKLPERQLLYASHNALHTPETLFESFPTFATHVLPAEPSTSTEAVLLAYSTYTVLANTFGMITFYLPNHDQSSHLVTRFCFMHLYYLIHAVHITMNITPLVNTPDVDTVPLLSDWMTDLHTIMFGPEFTMHCYAPALYDLIPYPDDVFSQHPSLPLKYTHPSTHQLILTTVHPILQPLFGTLRSPSSRIFYRCRQLCTHAPPVLFEANSIIDAYFVVTFDITVHFAQANDDTTFVRDTPQRRQFVKNIQSLPVEIRAHILNYHIENEQTPDCHETSPSQVSTNKTSFIRVSYLPLHAPTRRNSSEFAEFFVHMRTSIQSPRRNSFVTTPYGQTFSATRIQRIATPVPRTSKDMHIDLHNLSLSLKTPPPSCPEHSETLSHLQWTS